MRRRSEFSELHSLTYTQVVVVVSHPLEIWVRTMSHVGCVLEVSCISHFVVWLALIKLVRAHSIEGLRILVVCLHVLRPWRQLAIWRRHSGDGRGLLLVAVMPLILTVQFFP